MKLTLITDRFATELHNQTFRDVCRLTGGEYSTRGKEEVCFYQRGPLSATEIILDNETNEVRVYDMSKKPFSSDRKEYFTDSISTVRLPYKPSFTCTVIHDQLPQGEPFFKAYVVECRSDFTEERGDPFSRDIGTFHIGVFVSKTANIKIDYYDRQNYEYKIRLKLRLAKTSPVVERVKKIIERMKEERNEGNINSTV